MFATARTACLSLSVIAIAVMRASQICLLAGIHKDQVTNNALVDMVLGFLPDLLLRCRPSRTPNTHEIEQLAPVAAHPKG
jgi:hypothetical protein